MSLPNPGFEFDRDNTAMVIIDPQNDFLSPKGVAWGVVGESVTENRTVENIESLFKAAKEVELPVFVCRTTTIHTTISGDLRVRSSD